MKKMITSIMAILLCATMFTACGKNSIHTDLLDYEYNQLPPVVDLNTQISTDYASVTGANYKDDKTTMAKLKDVILPESNKEIKLAKAIVPKTKEVREVHDIYIASITEQNEAFVMLLQALKTNNAALITPANNKINDAIAKAKDYMAKVSELEKKYNVHSNTTSDDTQSK